MESRIIKFYTTGKPYDIFSNVTDIPILVFIEGQRFTARSTEAVYQGMKGLLDPYQHQAGIALINSTKTPGGHLQKSGQQFKPGNKFFHNRVKLMRELVLMKATQHPAIARALLDTYPATIVENTKINKRYEDKFWGNGWDGKGKNNLGKAWDWARKVISNELNASNKITVRYSFSDELTNTLGLRPSHPQKSATISKTQLSRCKPVTTVAEFQKITTPPPLKMGWSATQQSAAQRVQATLLKHYPSISGIRATANRDKHYDPVIVFTFSKSSDATKFAKAHRSKVSADNSKKVFLTKGKAEHVFEKFNVPMHGRTNKYPMYQALLFENDRIGDKKSARTYHRRQAQTLQRTELPQSFGSSMIGFFYGLYKVVANCCPCPVGSDQADEYDTVSDLKMKLG